jgi:hypothetical protein
MYPIFDFSGYFFYNIHKILLKHRGFVEEKVLLGSRCGFFSDIQLYGFFLPWTTQNPNANRALHDKCKD